jgi:hypothetical protein
MSLTSALEAAFLVHDVTVSIYGRGNKLNMSILKRASTTGAGRSMGQRWTGQYVLGIVHIESGCMSWLVWVTV